MQLRPGRSASGGAALAAAAYYAYAAGDGRPVLVRAQEDAVGLQRMGRAATAFTRLAAHYKLDKYKYGGGAREPSRSISRHQWGADLVLDLCRRNGSVFIKMGQHAGSLAGALPREYIDTLKVLQDRAPVRPWAEVKRVIDEELPGFWADVAHVDREPVGSASLAQVHRVVLRSGEELAIKVQHGDVRRAIAGDLAFVKVLNGLAAWLFREDGFSLLWAVEEFERNLSAELNFEAEATNAERCRANFAADAHPRLRHCVVVPAVRRELSTERVLCMDFVRGTPIHDVERLKRDGVDLAEVAGIVLEAFSAMIFRHGFVHCDPHPGNLMVCADAGGGNPRLALLDHGLYRGLDDDFRASHCRLWRGMILQDQGAVEAACDAMGMPTMSTLIPFMLVNRPLDAKAGLGQALDLSPADKAALKARLGITSVGVADLGAIADRLPNDFLLVIKTMHLIKDLDQALGGSNRQRFLTYARDAVTADAAWLPSLQWHLFLLHLYFNEAWLPKTSGGYEAPTTPSLSISTIIGGHH